MQKHRVNYIERHQKDSKFCSSIYFSLNGFFLKNIFMCVLHIGVCIYICGSTHTWVCMYIGVYALWGPEIDVGVILLRSSADSMRQVS